MTTIFEQDKGEREKMYRLISGKECDFIEQVTKEQYDQFIKSISPEVIAHSLSQINRWNGHTIVPVNVAWHSVSVTYAALDIVKSNWPSRYDKLKVVVAFEALLHDVAETYIGDIVAPIKGLFFVANEAIKGLTNVSVIEWGLLDAIKSVLWNSSKNLAIRHSGNFEIDAIIHRADIQVREMEKMLWTKPLSSAEDKDEMWFMEYDIQFKMWKMACKQISGRCDYWMPYSFTSSAKESRRKWLEIWEDLVKGEVNI